MKIKNCPSDAWNYEFIVAYNREGELVYDSHTADGFEAEQIASEIDGVVIHNVKIQGYKEEPKKEKFYTFSGLWYWGCCAESKDEAIEKFKNEAYAEELDISGYDEIIEEEMED